MRTSVIKSFAALFFGLCIPLAMAPFFFWPLVFVGIGGFFWLSLSVTTTKQALWYGWLYGAGFFGLGVSWVYGSMQTVGMAVPVALFLTGGFCLLLALLHAFQLWFFVRFLRGYRLTLLLHAPLWWLLCEWLREWLFTGMPWLFTGYALLPTPSAQVAAIVGIYGVSLFAAVVSALLLKALLHFVSGKNTKGSQFLAGGIALFSVVSILGTMKPADQWTTVDQTLVAAAVQSNISQRQKWQTAQQRPTLEFFGDSLANMSEADFILWPEAAMTQLPHQIPSFLSQVQDIGARRDQSIITGTLIYEDGRFYNSMRGYGQASGDYKKQHLVPFGEYIPFEAQLKGLLDLFNLPNSSMYPAPSPQNPISFMFRETPYFAAPIICYEAAYPHLVKTLARESDLITVVSNDAWFGDSLGPHQHLQITQMRAIENGRDIVRATQNGISALINARGDIEQKSAQFVEAEVIGEVTLRSGSTPFQKLPYGSIIWPCLIILTASIGLQRRLTAVK